MGDIPAIGAATQGHGPPVREDLYRPQPSETTPPADKSEETARRPDSVGVRAIRSVEIDPATKSVVFRLTSETTGFVVAQNPSEVQLRVRQYLANADAAAKWQTPRGRTA